MSAKRISIFVAALCMVASANALAMDEESFFTTPPSAWEQFGVSPAAFQKEAEAAVKGESWFMRAQYFGLHRFNLLEPTPVGVARSGVDIALDAAFRFSDTDETKEKIRQERYRLAKARYRYHQLVVLFPDSPEAKQATVRIGKLNVRLQKLDAKLGSRGLDEKILNRPAPRTVAWAAFGDRPVRDLVSLGTAAVFSGPMAPIMGGVFWTVSAGQRGWALYDHAGLTPEERIRELEFLAAEVRVLPYEKKEEGLKVLGSAYEDIGATGTFAKAADTYAMLAQEYPEAADQYRDKFKKSRERLADSIYLYAEEKGDAASFHLLANEFLDTSAGRKAVEQIEKKGIPKPQAPKLREAHINAGAGGSGFDFSGGGSAGGYRFDAGIMNASQPYGEAAIPWNIPGLKGSPAISGGPGRLSLFLMLDKHAAPSDAELFE